MPKIDLSSNIKFSVLAIYFIAFAIFLLPRVINLGSDISNFDSQYWYPRIDIFTDKVHDNKLNELYLTYHPGTTLLWTSGFANYFYRMYFEYKRGFDPRGVPHHFIDIQFFTILPLVLMISGLGLYVFHMLKKMKGTYFSLIFTLLLSLEPFFLGVSKFLHITGLQTMFGFTGLLCITYYIFTPKRRNLFLSGLLLGLAVSTKITAVLFIIVGFVLLMLYEYNLTDFDSTKSIKKLLKIHLKHLTKLLINFCVVGVTACITFYIVNPFMWFDPLNSLMRIYTDGVVENGFGSTGAPQIVRVSYMFYLEYGVYRLSGYTIILGLFGLIYIIKNFKRTKADQVLMTAIVYFILYNLLLTIPNKLKDRYLVEIIPAFILFATYGVIFLKNKLPKKTFIFTTVLIVIWIALNIYRYHPNYSFYMSDLVGGPKFMYENNLALMNRGEYFANAAIYLNTLEKPETKTVFFGNDTHVVTFKDFFRGKTFFDAGAIPNKTKLNYIVVRSNTARLDEINNYCKKIMDLGPKDPFGYTEINIYICENLYKEDLPKIKIQS